MEVDPVTTRQLVEYITATIRSGGRLLIGNHNLHSAYLVKANPEIMRFYDRADVVYVDGMPLVVANRLRRGPMRRTHRSTLLDWIDPLLGQASTHEWTVFLLGSAPGVVERSIDAYARRHPGVHFGSHHGHFDADGPEGAAVITEINRWSPDLLLVGMGMPRQELWLADNLDRLDARVAMAVGGLFDYAAGVTLTPPRWAGSVGLEWLVRLLADPRRLARRYLLEPMLLAYLLVRDRRS